MMAGKKRKKSKTRVLVPQGALDKAKKAAKSARSDYHTETGNPKRTKASVAKKKSVYKGTKAATKVLEKRSAWNPAKSKRKK